MTTTALVPVFAGDNGATLCNARDLHAVLESGYDFSNWIKERIEKYGFTEGEDFSRKSLKTSRRGGRPATDYHLTLDMAKELAMVENNERGRQVRRYFIQVEKAARTKALPAPSFDFAGTLRAGNRTPTVPLPAEVQTAINRKAWAMAGGAYDLCREYLARRVAYDCEYGHPERRLDAKQAQAVIEEATLDQAMAPRHHNQLAAVLRMTEMVADMARDNLAKMREELKARVRHFSLAIRINRLSARAKTIAYGFAKILL